MGEHARYSTSSLKLLLILYALNSHISPVSGGMLDAVINSVNGMANGFPKTQVDQEELYDAKIVKLTLQPIVENAIFNGIEPSGRNGLIQIHVYTENGILYISVKDNGIGISPENIEKLLTDTSRITRSNMSGIGLPNVDRRLKLVYGEEYGLKLESELDQYTLITIALPLEF